MPFGFGALVGAAEFESARLWALGVVLFCAEGLLLLEGGGGVVLGFRRRLALLALRRLRRRGIVAAGRGRARFRIVVRLESAALP